MNSRPAHASATLAASYSITMTTLATTTPSQKLWTPRWYPLRDHPTQIQLIQSAAQFNIACAGRRSGKTERAKRKIVSEAISFDAFADGRFVCLAPTQEQAKEIYWEDLKALVPDWALSTKRRQAVIESSPQTIHLWNGARIMVKGMDKPIRVEGQAIDGFIADEFADWKPLAWQQSLRPAVSTPGRPGWGWFIGKPRGRNHYWQLCNRAMKDKSGRWAYFHWNAEDILDEDAIEGLREDLDELSYNQEVRAQFINFEGRAYYDFDRLVHCEPLVYDPRGELILCFDFNRSPGVCAIVQEQEYRGRNKNVDDDITGVVGEVHIPKNSNTPRVCRKILADWGRHKGKVKCYGDANGGIEKTQSVDGSDWDLVEAALRPVYGERLRMMQERSNPPERVRVNAVNTRIKNAAGKIRFMVDPDKAPNTVDDFEGVTVLEGGCGELDKDNNPEITHLSDAVGYYIAQVFPMGESNWTSEAM